MVRFITASVALALLLDASSAFTFVKSPTSITFPSATSVNNEQSNESSIAVRSSALFMGRAAAVRAATKGKTDAKKAKTNAYYGKKIIMAVKQGGSADPQANRALGELIKQAKASSVPVDNINRAIKRASEANTADFKESTFEAYGFGGASMIINVLTDNDNRATADVKSTVGKRNAKMAESGSVLFMYDRKGKLEVNVELDEEELLEAAIEAGCEDMELVEGDEEGTSIVYSEPADTSKMAEAIRSLGHEPKMNLAYGK